MTQPTTQSSKANVADPRIVVDPREDPAMRSLFRMSRTAGVGLGDYAAVNVLAVTGLMLACASVLVLIFADATPLLLIPLAAILISLFAFWQVRASNGTQTGQGIAVCGLVLALVLGGTNVYGRFAIAAAHRRDAATLRSIVDEFAKNISAKNSPAAYELFDARFRDAVGQETFARTVDLRIANRFIDHSFVGMALGENVFFDSDPLSGVAKADALLIVYGAPTLPDGSHARTEEPIEFRLSEGQWKIHSIVNWFDAAVTASKAKATR